MANIDKMTPQEIKIQGILSRYLTSRKPPEPETHLDQDTLAAFTEGSLSERETKPVVAHLVECSFCRHITAELVRLDLAFAEDEALPRTAETGEPSKISAVLSGLFAKMFGTGEVFAHNEDEKKEEKEKKDSKDESE